MSEQPPESEAIIIAHLSMLQGVIARMGSNSFALKALSATFGSAAIGIMGASNQPQPYYILSALIPIIIFWVMDANYLRYERGYRKLFDKVRRGEKVDRYTLDAVPFLNETGKIHRIMFTWSLFGFYVALCISVVGMGFILSWR